MEIMERKAGPIGHVRSEGVQHFSTKKKKKGKNTAPINKCKRELGVHKGGTALAKKGLKLQTIFFHSNTHYLIFLMDNICISEKCRSYFCVFEQHSQWDG